jgi:hypothetical protein
VTLINAPAGVNPLTVRFQPVNDEQAIGAANPGIDANTLRVFYTGGLASGANGESWPDVDFAGQAQVGSSFINGPGAVTSTLRHEIGHVLTNKAVAASGAHYAQPAAPAGNHLFARQNVMSAASAANPTGVAGSKRLWDAPDADGNNQFTSIRASRFVRPF